MIREQDISNLFKLIYSNSLIYVLIGLSGIILFMENRAFLICFFLILLVSSMWVRVPRKGFKYFLFVLSAVLIVTSIQFITFNTFILNSLLSLLIVFSVGYAVNLILKERFVETYISLVYFFSIISLVFYLAGLLFPAFFSTLGNAADNLSIDPFWTKNLLFFNFIDKDAIIFGLEVRRNPGFLYEPGMFACILLPALSFNTVALNSLANKKNFVFIIALVTTFSTAAYLALISFIVIYFIIYERFTLTGLSIATLVLVFFSVYLWQTEFIRGKINEQIDIALTASDSQRYRGRIGSALVDLEQIAQYPIQGRGRSQATRFNSDLLRINPNYSHRTNGIFDLIAEMGIPFFLLYMYLLFNSINKFCLKQKRSKYAWMLFLIPYLIVSFSQTILLRPLFLALLFLDPNQAFKR